MPEYSQTPEHCNVMSSFLLSDLFRNACVERGEVHFKSELENKKNEFLIESDEW